MLKKHRALLAGVAAFAFALYARTLTYALVWDDLELVKLVGRSISRGGIPELLTAEFTFNPLQPMGYHRPVVLFSLWLDSLVTASWLPSYHLTNVAINTVVCVLVFHLITLTGGGRVAALAGALLFATHPAHVEAVTFVSGRTDLLASFFLLIAIIAWLRDRGAGVRGRWPWRATGMISFGLALFSKEVSFLLPAVLLAWDLVFPRGVDREAPARRWWERNRFWILGWGAVVAGAILLRVLVAGIGFGAGSAAGAALAGHRPPLAIARIVAMNVRLLMVPWPLNAYYTDDQLAFGATTLLGCALFSILCLALVLAGRGRNVLASLAWIGGFLLPTLGLVAINGSPVAERFLYFPSVGLALMVGHGWDSVGKIDPSRRRGIAAILLVVLAVLGFGTLKRQAVWRDEMTFFSDFVKTSPRFPGAWYNLASAHANAGRLEEAVSAYETTLRLDPNFPPAHHNAALLYLGLGRADKAMEHYLALEKKDPEAARRLLPLIKFSAP